MRPHLYAQTRVIAPSRPPADPLEAQMLARLATKAQELASEHGIVLTRKEALQRARCNLAFVKAMHGAKVVKP